MVAWLALIGVLLILAIQLWPKLSPLVSRLAAGAKGIDLRNVLIVALLLCLGAVLVGQRGCAMPEWTRWSWTSSAPFAADKLTVLVVEESDPSQDSAAPVWINSTKAGSVRDYVTKRGGSFRLIDQNNPSDLAAPEWQAALAVERKAVPWIVAAGPRTGISQPLPATAAATLSLLEGVK